jgi:hypothetical protein
MFVEKWAVEQLDEDAAVLDGLDRVGDLHELLSSLSFGLPCVGSGQTIGSSSQRMIM